jgi:phage gpG-like protein
VADTVFVYVVGADVVSAKLSLMAAQMPQIGERAALRGAEVVRRYAVTEGFRSVGEVIGTTRTGRTQYAALGEPIPDTLTSRTGMLRSSIRTAPITGGAAVGPTAVYGRIHELGGTTGARTITARNARFLRFKGADGNWLFRRSVHHPGSKIPARPYLRPAIENHLSEVGKAVYDSITASVKAEVLE